MYFPCRALSVGWLPRPSVPSVYSKGLRSVRYTPRSGPQRALMECCLVICPSLFGGEACFKIRGLWKWYLAAPWGRYDSASRSGAEARAACRERRARGP